MLRTCELQKQWASEHLRGKRAFAIASGDGTNWGYSGDRKPSAVVEINPLATSMWVSGMHTLPGEIWDIDSNGNITVVPKSDKSQGQWNPMRGVLSAKLGDVISMTGLSTK